MLTISYEILTFKKPLVCFYLSLDAAAICLIDFTVNIEQQKRGFRPLHHNFPK
jgi:hypothetical protein